MNVSSHTATAAYELSRLWTLALLSVQQCDSQWSLPPVSALQVSMLWGLHNLTALSIASSQVSILCWVSTKAEVAQKYICCQQHCSGRASSRQSKMQPASTCTETEHGASSCTPCDYARSQNLMKVFQEGQPLHSKEPLSHCA